MPDLSKADVLRICASGTVQSSSASLSSSGNESQQQEQQQSSSSQSQTTVMEIPETGFYAIADAVDTIAAKDADQNDTTAGIMMLDCISVAWFKQTLVENINDYEQLRPDQLNQLTQSKTETRNKLLTAIVPVGQDAKLPNRRMVLIYIPPGKVETAKATFPPGKWINVAITCGEAADNDPTALLETDPSTLTDPIFIVTHSLYDHYARNATAVTVSRSLTEDETALLEQIFSLNHVPDADLGDGTTTPPPAPVPAPIVLDEGGFLFGGDDTFWQEAKVFSTVTLDERTIQPWPNSNAKPSAKHQGTGEVYEVEQGEEDDDSEYQVILRSSSGDGFELTIDDNGRIQVKCVLMVDQTAIAQDAELKVTITKGDVVCESEGAVEDLFPEKNEDSNSNVNSDSSSSTPTNLPPTPWAPKIASRIKRVDLTGYKPKTLSFDSPTKTESTKPSSTSTEMGASSSTGGKGKGVDDSEANKENIHPNLTNITKLHRVIDRKTTQVHKLSPKKTYWR